MALKWNDHDIKLERVFSLMPQWEPLFGHLTKDGPGSKTYWAMLLRKNISIVTGLPVEWAKEESNEQI
jgi:hypothetical protein